MGKQIVVGFFGFFVCLFLVTLRWTAVDAMIPFMKFTPS